MAAAIVVAVFAAKILAVQTTVRVRVIVLPAVVVIVRSPLYLLHCLLVLLLEILELLASSFLASFGMYSELLPRLLLYHLCAFARFHSFSSFGGSKAELSHPSLPLLSFRPYSRHCLPYGVVIACPSLFSRIGVSFTLFFLFS